MPNYSIFNSSYELNTRKKITVVTECDDGILIQDFQYGQPVDEGEFYSPADIGDSILGYPYKKEVFVEADAAGKYDCLVHMAQLFRDCGGDLESYAEAMEAEMENEFGIEE